ncbi:hypothetical protein ACQKLG_04935 [Pedobacter suwonensis]|uniref:hypothetical protein n=2 Tax=Pedobacter suwonensis TaxID=332999 RepID=UPI0037F54281
MLNSFYAKKPFAMTANNRYLPLFFLCWAFLYSPFAVWSIWLASAGGHQQVVAEKSRVEQVSQHPQGGKPVPDDLTCFCTFYGNKAWGFNCNLNFLVYYYLTGQEGVGHDGK